MGILSDEMREELVQGLTDILGNNISMIILYGSAARGDATQESDVDIAIVVKNQMDDATKRRFLSWAADMDIRYERVFFNRGYTRKQYEEVGRRASFLPECQSGGDCFMERSLKLYQGQF